MKPKSQSGLSSPDRVDQGAVALSVPVTEVSDDLEPQLTAEVLGPQAARPPRRQRPAWRRAFSVSILGVALLAGMLLAMHVVGVNKRVSANTSSASLQVKPQTIPLNNLHLKPLSSLSQANALTVNGNVDVNNSVVLNPTAAPSGAVAGQLYFDQQKNQLGYFNGTSFVYVQGGAGGLAANNVTNVHNVNNVTNVTNIYNFTNAVTGPAGVIPMFDGSGLTDSMISQVGDNISTGTGLENVTIGSTSGASNTVVQGGTGNVAINTGAVTGTSGAITIESGASSTTAAGNVTVDTGESIINGTLIADKTFEDGTTDNMGDGIFGDNSTVSLSTAQAHSGSYSLAVSVGSGFYPSWAVGDGTGTPPYIIPVVAGHTYALQAWVRAGTNSDTITASVIWSNDGYGGGGEISQQDFGTVTDISSGWRKVAGVLTAPQGAYSMGFYFYSSDAQSVGEVHYFDDITLTDLSTAPVEATLNLGSTNAQAINIGNTGMLAPTTIDGGGVTISGGAGFINESGGYLTLSGTTGGSISTSTGALTLTSGTAASWGVGGSTYGGGDLTLHAGSAGGNDNGGNLYLEGGAGAGTGTSGSVIVKPPSDSTAAFQVQSAGGGNVLNVDTTSNTIQVDNGHVSLVGVAAPNVAPTATTTGSGILNGTYYYEVTYVTASGETYSGPNVSVTPVNQEVSLTNIPTGPAGVIARRIYRTNVNPPWPYTGYLLTTLNDNSTTSYLDNVADSGLGAAAPSYNSTSYITNPQGEGGSEAFGQNATVTSADATAVGNGSTAYWASVSVGHNASSGSSGSVAIGDSSSATFNAVSVGQAAQAGNKAVAVGVGANGNNNSIAIGADAIATTSYQLVIGGTTSNSSYIQNAFIGSGVTDATPKSVTIHATGGSGTDVAGASLTLAGGIGTGMGAGGNIAFQIALPSVSSGSTANALATVANISGVNGAALFKNATNSTTAFQIQNSSGVAVLTADTTNSIVTVTNLVVTGSLTVDGHIITGGSTPAIAAGVAACTSPTVNISGNDTSGTITVTTGTGCVSGALATVTFASAFSAAPHVVVTPGGSNAAGLNAYVDDSTVSTTNFTLGTTVTPTATTTYEWNYFIAQ